ncbi:hypothetical protein P7D22_00980, partial [Lichenihabitans sp. Uapishka_5]|uniref:hypothetical protein n=1 Tax=Lichenihabitans sp. Uapishka_5 TaxID=3037302 RepID=UPI0029F35CCD|nr:hypothetical protein [Lichenihabitans sp. Uapishka_5]
SSCAKAARRRAALAQIDTIAVDANELATLSGLERAVDRARAELDVASVQISFAPEGVRTVVLDGVVHAASEPLALTRDATLELEGFGRLHLRPGGGTAALGRKLDDAERALNAALSRLGTANMAEAHRLSQMRGDAASEAAALTKTLAVLAPKGVDALRQAVEAGAARLARDQEGTEPSDAAGLADARRKRDAARSAVQASEAARRAAAFADGAAATEAATLDERRDAALRQRDALSDELAAVRGRVDDDLLTGRLTAAEALLGAALAAEASAKAAVAASDVEATRLTLERSERAEREIRRDLATLEGEQRDLRVELRAIGQDGLGERLSALEGEIEAGRSRLGALEREAAASRLLHETLVAAQRDAKERWLGPVRDRVTPYLRLIHPESEIRLDDQSLEIEGLYRDGVLEQFGALSMGAREQVAVVTRLALADILKAAGHPAAVILDDALVNTDDARLDRMRNVLTRAARGLQILILTCRERDFLGLGATHRF